MKRSRMIHLGLLVVVVLVTSAVVAALAFGRSTAGPPVNPGPPGAAAGQLTITDSPTNSPSSITLGVQAYSWGVSNPVTIGTGSGGSSAGRARLSSLNVTTAVDASFPVLNAAVAAGKKFPTATLTFPSGNGTVTFQLDNVIIQSAQQSGGGGALENSLSLAYEKVTWTFTDASGTTTRNWDIVHNLPA